MTSRNSHSSIGHSHAGLAARGRASSLCYVGLLVLISSIFVPAPSQVEAQPIALAPGQWARYSIAGPLSEGVTTSLYTVLRVEGPTVTFNSVDTYSDRSNLTENFSIDLVTGQGVEPGFFPAIFPGKGVGDPVYQNSDIFIRERQTRTYAQASRQVNHAYDSNATGDDVSYYWDLETGIFTEILRRYVDSKTGQLLVRVQARMTETNIWTPDSPVDAALLYTAAVTATSTILVATVLLGRYARKKRRR